MQFSSHLKNKHFCQRPPERSLFERHHTGWQVQYLTQGAPQDCAYLTLGKDPV